MLSVWRRGVIGALMLSPFVLLASLAQSQPAQDDAVRVVGSEWEAVQNSQRHLADALQKLVSDRAALQQQLAAERAWWAGYLSGLYPKTAEGGDKR